MCLNTLCLFMDLMFFLLQLGFAKEYILAAAKISQQFLWNMQANMYTDEEGKMKDGEGDVECVPKWGVWVEV